MNSGISQNTKSQSLRPPGEPGSKVELVFVNRNAISYPRSSGQLRGSPGLLLGTYRAKYATETSSEGRAL